MAGEGSDKDSVMLVRERLSRIYFNKQFFDYPLKINAGSLRKLGIAKVATFGVGYVGSRLRPVVPEKSLKTFLSIASEGRSITSSSKSTPKRSGGAMQRDQCRLGCATHQEPFDREGRGACIEKISGSETGQGGANLSD